jgi:hypothetical protein
MQKQSANSPLVTKHATAAELDKKLPATETMQTSRSCFSRWRRTSKSVWAMAPRAAMAPADDCVIASQGIKNPHRTQAMPTPDDAPGCIALSLCRRRMTRLATPQKVGSPLRGSCSDFPWTGLLLFCILQTSKKSRETVGLTVFRTCKQQGLNRCMFYDCGAAAYGHIT